MYIIFITYIHLIVLLYIYSKIPPTYPWKISPGCFTNSLCFGIPFELWGWKGKFGGPSSQGPCGQNHWYMVNDTLQGTNISPKNGILKMIFLFPRWDMLVPWRVSAPGRWPELRLPRPRPCLWFASSGGYRIESERCRWIPWGDPGSVENQVGRLLKQGVI